MHIVCVYKYAHIYIYICREREREREMYTIMYYDILCYTICLIATANNKLYYTVLGLKHGRSKHGSSIIR